jgi:formyl-CoA transferase
LELDLSNPDDQACARELAARADVFIENFRDGALAKYGLDYESVRASNRRVVYCSITGFGSKAGADLAGYDFLVQAVGGLMSITGESDREPLKVGVALVDVLTAKDAVVGILAALRSREGAEFGQRVEVNLLSSLLGSLANQAAAYVMTGTVPTRMGNEHPSIAPYETLLCSDGHLAICCGNDSQFGRLTEVLGIAETASDPRFVTNAERVRNRPNLIKALSAAMAVDTVDSWVERLQAAGIPAGRVGDIADAFELADRLGLEPIVSVQGDGPPQVRHPITFSGTPVSQYQAPPRLGEHNDEIRQWLASTDKKEPS